MKTVVGAFPSMGEAERVARDLEEMGIDKDEISVIAGNEAGAHDEYLKKPTSTGAAAASAASFGGGVGIVAGLIALAIPGVGPIIAGGALATVLTGLGVGAAAGGLVGAFTNMGVSHEEAPLYQEAVRRGGVVVAVHVNDPMEQDAMRVMDEHGARDLNAEADAWRASGWTGPYSNPHPYPSDSGTVTHVRSETVNLDESRSTASRRSRTSARSYPYQKPAAGTEPYQGSAAFANQTPGAATAQTPGPATAQTSQSETNQFPVRRGPVHISDDDPAYVFGNRWASDPNYYGHGWTDVESSLRSNWEAMGTGPWDTFRDRVRRGYEAGSEDPAAPRAPEDKPGQRGY
jgi:uncharacterized membrane protein